jgi:two-component system chemotaxis family response regulator WspR
VAALNLPHVAPADGSCVTVSIGIATRLPSSVESFERIVKLADGALYKAKHKGRNCAVVVEARTSAAA